MKKIWCLLMWFLVSCAYAEDLEFFTLSDAVEYGVQNNPVIRESKYQITGAEYEIKSVRGQFFPTLSTGYSSSWISSIDAQGPTESDYLDQNSQNFNVKLSQVLYAGSRILSDYQRAKAQKQMYRARQAMILSEQTYQIETAFFTLMKAKADVAAAEDTVKRLETSVRAVTAYFEGEMVPYVQVLEAKSELSSAKSAFIMAKNKVEKEKASLMSILNLPVSKQVVFHGSLDYYPAGHVVDFQTVWQQARETRPDLEALEQQKIMAAKQAKMEMSKYLPTVRLDASYNDSIRDYADPGSSLTGTFDRDQENQYWQAGVSVQWNFFDGGTAWFRRKKFLTEINILTQRIISLENTIKMKLQQAVLSIPEATARIRITSEAVQVGKEFYLGEKMRLEKGVSTMPSLLDAQERLTRMEAEFNNALFDYQLAMANLNYLSGTKVVVEFNQN